MQFYCRVFVYESHILPKAWFLHGSNILKMMTIIIMIMIIIKMIIIIIIIITFLTDEQIANAQTKLQLLLERWLRNIALLSLRQ